jgi:hypothetical protein
MSTYRKYSSSAIEEPADANNFRLKPATHSSPPTKAIKVEPLLTDYEDLTAWILDDNTFPSVTSGSSSGVSEMEDASSDESLSSSSSVDSLEELERFLTIQQMFDNHIDEETDIVIPAAEPSVASDITEQSISTNSWADGSDVEPDASSVSTYGWETHSLPTLTAEEQKAYELKRVAGEMPKRDEVDGVYRCLKCDWEIEDGYCEQCNTRYDTLVDLKSDDEANSTGKPPIQATQPESEPLSISLATSEAGAEATNSPSASKESATPIGSHDIDNWLSSLFLRLKSASDSTLSFLATSPQNAVDQFDEDLLKAKLAKISTLDQQAIERLHLEHSKYTKLERELKTAQEKILSLEDLLEIEKEKIWDLVSIAFECQQEFAERMQGGTESQSKVSKVEEWVAEVNRERAQKRSVSTQQEESKELEHKRRVPVLRGSKGSPKSGT